MSHRASNKSCFRISVTWNKTALVIRIDYCVRCASSLLNFRWYTKNMKVIGFVTIFWATWSSVSCFLLGGQNCKVQIDNHQAEIKQIISNQSNFNYNNWTHVGVMLILGIVGVLLLLAYCYFRVRICLLVKSFHTTNAINHHQQRQTSVVEKPYIIQLSGQGNSGTCQDRNGSDRENQS
jgi:hypothetical protein